MDEREHEKAIWEYQLRERLEKVRELETKWDRLCKEEIIERTSMDPLSPLKGINIKKLSQIWDEMKSIYALYEETSEAIKVLKKKLGR